MPLPAPERSDPAKPGRQRGLLGSSLIVGGMTGVSRVAGLIRDMVLARVLGADGLADAFFVAFRLPNFLRRLFAEGAFSQAFVPFESIPSIFVTVKHLANCILISDPISVRITSSTTGFPVAVSWVGLQP